LMRSGLAVADGVSDCGEHWKSVTLLSLCGCGLSVSLNFFFFSLLSFPLRYICFGISGNLGFYSYDMI